MDDEEPVPPDEPSLPDEEEATLTQKKESTDVTKTSVSFSEETVAGSSFSMINDANLSKAASRTTERAIDHVLNELAEECADNAECEHCKSSKSGMFKESDIRSSTQVLVDPVPLPSESMANVAGRESMIKKHVIPVESSVFGEGIRLHRNNGEQDIDHPSQLGLAGAGASKPPGGIAGAFLDGLQGDSYTLADEIAAAVAVSKFDGPMDLSLFQDLYKKFKEILRVFTDGSPAQTPRTSHARGNNTIPRRSEQGSSGSAGSGGAQRRLPPEVKDRVLRTLSDVKAQLDTVKNQLLKQKSGGGGGGTQ